MQVPNMLEAKKRNNSKPINYEYKDVSLDELENDDALMYNKDTEKWENTDLEKPVGESVNKYLNEAVIDGGSAPTP